MKKLILLTFALVLIMAFSACNKEIIVDPPEASPDITAPPVEDEGETISGIFNGRVDMNFIEVMVDGQETVIMLNPDLRESFDEFGINEGDEILIYYTVNENQQYVANEINVIAASGKKADDFSLMLKNDKFISVLEWEDNISLKDILGNPVSEKTETVGPGGDTFAGSKIKTLVYDGMELKLMSPDGERFYILSITITSSDFSTFRGVRKGDRLNDIINAYPEISRIEDGVNDENNSKYVYMGEDFRYIDIYMKNAAAEKIVIGYELQ